jgi:hypothetical protein
MEDRAGRPFGGVVGKIQKLTGKDISFSSS